MGVMKVRSFLGPGWEYVDIMKLHCYSVTKYNGGKLKGGTSSGEACICQVGLGDCLSDDYSHVLYDGGPSPEQRWRHCS